MKSRSKSLYDEINKYKLIMMKSRGISHRVSEKFFSHALFKELIDSIKNGLGLTNVVAGYNSVFDLPLRPGAVKHSIIVVGSRCHGQFAPLEVLRALAYDALFEEMAYSNTLITVTPELKVGNGKNPSQIVGYTEKSVIMLGDKKQGKEAEALRPTLEVAEHDSCIEFVESSSGLVLSANNYLSLNPGQQKQFLQTSAAAITNKLLGETLLQSCTCGYVDPFRVRSLCYNKERKEVARRRK